MVTEPQTAPCTSLGCLTKRVRHWGQLTDSMTVYLTVTQFNCYHYQYDPMRQANKTKQKQQQNAWKERETEKKEKSLQHTPQLHACTFLPNPLHHMKASVLCWSFFSSSFFLCPVKQDGYTRGTWKLSRSSFISIIT